jgi:hypothetical protein
MSLLKKVTGAQYPITAIFSFQASDTMVNAAGATVSFGDAAPGAFDIFYPPPGAMVIGGGVKIETVAVGNTQTVDIGDSDDTDRYTETGAIDLADPDAPWTGFEMLGDHKVYDGSQAIRVTFANGGAVTATKAHIIVTMVMIGRANENLKTT